MSSLTHSTVALSRFARSLARFNITSERSTPVTRYPLRESGMVWRPRPHPRSTTDAPEGNVRRRSIWKTSFSGSCSSGPNSSWYRSSKIVSYQGRDNDAPPVGTKTTAGEKRPREDGEVGISIYFNTSQSYLVPAQEISRPRIRRFRKIILYVFIRHFFGERSTLGMGKFLI